MAINIDQIRTAGNKKVPHGTQVLMSPGSVPGTVRIRIKLPGQKDFSELMHLQINEECIELPLQLLFFSHAHEDQAHVEKIVESLWQDGFLTWLDKKDLVPGDDWQAEIEIAMDKADFVLAFLSKASVQKVGYVQKEFKYALEQSRLRPSGKRYIIPILLEPCTPPRELQHLQWLPLWEDGAYEKLKKALSS